MSLFGGLWKHENTQLALNCTPEDGMWLPKWRMNYKRSHTLPLLWSNAEKKEKEKRKKNMYCRGNGVPGIGTGSPFSPLSKFVFLHRKWTGVDRHNYMEFPM